MLVSTIAFLVLGLSFDEIEEREIGGPDQTVTVVTMGPVSYRKVEPEDLLSPVLNGQGVYVEGKFRSTGTRRNRLIFSMLGSDAEFAYANPGLVAGVMRGDNIWVAGKAVLYRGEPDRRKTCYVQVSVMVPFPPDKKLFAIRFARYDAKKDWKKMLKLAEWVEKASKLTERSGFSEFEQYKRLRRKALVRGFYLRGEVLDRQSPRPELALEYYDLAITFYDELKAASEAEKYLLRALSLDPTYEKAANKLREFGYVEFRGRYMTKAEKLRILAEDARQAEVASAQAEKPARNIGSLVERAKLMEQVTEAARKGASGLEELVEVLKTYSDPPLHKAVAFHMANLPDPAGLKGLIAVAQSPTTDVRRLAVKMLRRRATKRATSALADVARSDPEQDVRLEALSAIASLKSKACIEALIGLAGAKDEELKAAAAAHLSELTGKEFETHAEWQTWWQKSKLGFSIGP